MINSFLFIYIVNIGGNFININDYIDDKSLCYWLIFILFFQIRGVLILY